MGRSRSVVKTSQCDGLTYPTSPTSQRWDAPSRPPVVRYPRKDSRLVGHNPRCVCPPCGARRARRGCPALADQICAVCCGTKRLVQIECPADCAWLGERPRTSAGGRRPPATARHRPARRVPSRLRRAPVAVVLPRCPSSSLHYPTAELQPVDRRRCRGSRGGVGGHVRNGGPRCHLRAPTGLTAGRTPRVGPQAEARRSRKGRGLCRSNAMRRSFFVASRPPSARSAPSPVKPSRVSGIPSAGHLRAAGRHRGGAAGAASLDCPVTRYSLRIRAIWSLSHPVIWSLTCPSTGST